MTEWKELEINECCEVLSSKRIFAHDYLTEGVPFYRSKEIIEKAHGQFGKNELFISQPRFQDIKEKFGAPTKGDVLISAVGNRSGIPYCVKEEFDFYFKDGNLIWFRRFNDKLNSTFLTYILNSKVGQGKIESMMIGSAQKALTIAGIKKITLNLPPLPEQKAIAHVLGKLDDKIELNHKTNQTLVSMAQALFKSWFVDFDPVIDNALAGDPERLKDIPEALQAKAQKRLQVAQHQKLATRNPKLAQLFPNRFEFNETLDQWIPEGWEVKRLNKLVNIKYGKDHKKLKSGNFPCYGSGGIMRYVERPLYEKESILIPRKGTLSNIIYIDKPFWTVDTMFYSEVLDENIGKYFYYAMCRLDMNEMNEGSAVPSMTTALLNSLWFLRPSDMVLEKFNLVLDSNYNKQKAGQHEIKTLTNLRNTLLPQLISGKLRLPKELVAQFDKTPPTMA